jgi:hypothetical protein
VGGHLEDTNRWAPGGKNVRVHGEASHGKITLNRRKEVWEHVWRIQIGGHREVKM